MLKLSPTASISESDRSRNILITGMSGVGLSTYMLDLLLQEIHAKTPVLLFDRYGDLSNRLFQNATEEMIARMAYLDMGNREFPVGINIFDVKSDQEKREVCNAVIALMYDLYDPKRTGVIGPRFDHAVRNAMLTIMEDAQGASFIELVRCLTDSSYVQRILPQVKDEMVREYWTKQISQTSDFHKSEVLDYIVSKFGPFITDSKMRAILGQTRSSVDVSRLITERSIIIVDFGKLLGDPEATKLITAVFMVKLLQGLRRPRRDTGAAISIYFEEVESLPQNLITELLREGRRYGVSITAATTRLSEIEEPLEKELVNVGSLISFRVNTDSARILAPEFHQSLSPDVLAMLKKFHIVMRYLKDGNPVAVTDPVNLERDIPAQSARTPEDVERIKLELHRQYSLPYDQVKQDINVRLFPEQSFAQAISASTKPVTP